jgi:hypothetical protein
MQTGPLAHASSFPSRSSPPPVALTQPRKIPLGTPVDGPPRRLETCFGCRYRHIWTDADNSGQSAPAVRGRPSDRTANLRQDRRTFIGSRSLANRRSALCRLRTSLPADRQSAQACHKLVQSLCGQQNRQRADFLGHFPTQRHCHGRCPRSGAGRCRGRPRGAP